MSGLLAMKLIFSPWMLCVITITVVSANECALNSECRPIADCPLIRDSFNLIKRKPYCNLDRPGAHVCCRRSSQNYTQPKYVDFRVIRECRSYDSVPSLQNALGEECRYTSNIDGRVKVESKEFPFMALLYRKDGERENFTRLCSGTLISKKYILTSAHCFSRYDSHPNWARLGELDYNTNRDDALSQNIEIKHYTLHREYYKTKLARYNNIALAELAQEAIFNDYVRPACLSLTLDANDFQEFLIAGWGWSSPESEPSTHLYKMKFDRLDDEKCFEIYRYRLEKGINNRTHTCAIPSTGDVGICNGDGPLFVTHPEFPCQFLVVGYFSFRHDVCGSKDDPDVYTRIRLYTDWIQSIVWN